MIAEDSHEYEVQEENYFISMTDMMVGLIFIFIILIMYYAVQLQSETQRLKVETQRLDGSGTRSEILAQLKERLEKELNVQIFVDNATGVLRLPDSILFDSGQAELKPDGKTAISHLAGALSDILPCYTSDGGRRLECSKAEHLVESVYIEGHTDADAYSAAGRAIKDNWDLSAIRATNTFRAVVDARPDLTSLCTQVVEQRCEPVLSVSGYGPQRPVSPGSSDADKRKNRRIDLRLVMVTPDAGEAKAAIEQHLIPQ